MSGHSKWSKVKHQKEATDAVKGKVFTKLANAIIVAVRESSGVTDPEANFKLRLAIERARSFNMPKENIMRAVEKGKGIGGAGQLTQTVYEAFGPKGVGIIIEATTDNKLRTVAEIKNILERGGGVLATTGAVAHFFQLTGLIHITKENKTFDEIMEAAINSGAIDLEDTDETVEIYTNPADLHIIKEKLIKNGFCVSSFELFYRPKNTIPIDNREDSKKVLDLLAALEEIEDVQKVSSNFEIPDAFL